jgi:hypothetical protein
VRRSPEGTAVKQSFGGGVAIRHLASTSTTSADGLLLYVLMHRPSLYTHKRVTRRCTHTVCVYAWFVETDVADSLRKSDAPPEFNQKEIQGLVSVLDVTMVRFDECDYIYSVSHVLLASAAMIQAKVCRLPFAYTHDVLLTLQYRHSPNNGWSCFAYPLCL